MRAIARTTRNVICFLKYSRLEVFHLEICSNSSENYVYKAVESFVQAPLVSSATLSFYVPDCCPRFRSLSRTREFQEGLDAGKGTPHSSSPLHPRRAAEKMRRPPDVVNCFEFVLLDVPVWDSPCRTVIESNM